MLAAKVSPSTLIRIENAAGAPGIQDVNELVAVDDTMVTARCKEVVAQEAEARRVQEEFRVKAQADEFHDCNGRK